jgi:hypothetical protein
MAFNGWLSVCPITIPSSATTSASASVSGMPVLLNASNLPSQLLSASGGCLATGADIRFSTTSAGSDSLPREIVSINKTNGTIAIYVKVPVITKGSPTTIWCFWNNASASEPGKGDPAILDAVWSNYYGVFNFQGVTGTWKGINDSSGQYTNMSIKGTPNISAGPVIGTSAIVLTTACGMSYNELVTFATTSLVTSSDFSFWVNQNGGSPVFNFGTGTNGIQYGMLTAGQFGVSWGLFSTTTGAIPSTGWHHIYCRGVNGTYSVYVDGKLNNSGGSAGGQAFTTFGLGTTAGPATPFSVSDFRMTRNTNTPVDNIVTHYVNVTNIAGFATPGTVSTQSVASSLTFTGLATSSEVRIYTAGTTTELAGIENTDGTGIFTYNYSTGGNVDIQIYNIQYQPIRYTNFTLGASSTTIPIQQQYDRNYFNPA